MACDAFFIALSLIVVGSKTYTSIQRTAEQKLEFKDCRTYDDYSSFIKKYPDSSLKSTCDSILHEFNALRNDGRASVNNTGNRDIKDREKEWVDVKWNPHDHTAPAPLPGGDDEQYAADSGQKQRIHNGKGYG